MATTKVPHTSGLWRHVNQPISFTLVVNNFGVKYVGKEHADHLINAIKGTYKCTEDWKGELYCGISLKWDYEEQTLDFSMPGYIKEVLVKYLHDKPARPQHAP